ncbi:MAG: hypothetical protein NVSMB64_26880 [Candidatus Velthaea sp.]
MCADANILEVFLRVSDVLVGIVAGAVCSVLAAAFEAGILALRFFSIGHVGGKFGSDFLIVALLGAIVGGIVGVLVGAIVKPRERGPVR